MGGISLRWLLAAGAALCAALMGVALYMQHVMGLEPCPLCAVQRLLVISLGVVMAVAAVHGPVRVWRRVYGGLILLVSLVGVVVAGRHVWLQNLPPDEVPPTCGYGLDIMFQTFPLAEALEMLFAGSGECAEVQWTFLGLSIPGWTLVIFGLLACFGLWLVIERLVTGRESGTTSRAVPS